MKTESKKIFFIVIVILLFEIFAVSMVYNIYQINREEHAKDFKERQLLIANQVKGRIEDYFKGLSADINVMASSPSIANRDSDDYRKLMSIYYNELKDKIISIRFLNDKGILTDILSKNDGDGLIGKDYSSMEYFKVCIETGKPFISNVLTHETGAKEVHVSAPVFVEEKRGSKKLIGVVTADIDLDWVTKNFIAPVHPEREGYVWMMDANGTVLSQVTHPEMLFNNVFSNDIKCLECHSTFEPLKEVFSKGGGIFRYEVKGSSENYIIATPVDISSNKWVIAINIPVSQLPRINEINFRQTTLLMIFIAVTILLGAILILRINKERIISENREKYTAKILETKKLLENVIENSVDGIIIVDEKGIMLDVNGPACGITGYSRDELIGQHTAILSSPDEESRQRRLDSLAELFETGKLKSYENTWKRKNGELFPCDSSNSLFKDEKGDYTGGIVIFRDVTEKKKLQDALIEAQRLAAIGQVGITVKHEINNPLGGIIGYCELMLKHSENFSEDNLRRINDILKMALRIRDVIKRVQGLRDIETTDYIDGIKMININKPSEKEQK